MRGWGWQAVHHADHVERVRTKFADHMRRGVEWEDTFPLRSKDGEWRWFLSRAAPLRDHEGRVILWCGTNTDITEQREAEEVLRQHQSEIEDLNLRLRRAMRETHHRIKNNLQVIAGLVDVLALAAIHDLLTKNAKTDPTLDSLSVKAMLERLAQMLQTTLPERKIVTDVADVPLSVQKSGSLAMLVNEGVSNAIKHGKGDILLKLTACGTNACLEICDDGSGFPPNFDPRRAANTGLELIDSAARWDLRGELRYVNRPEGGGCVTVEFPLDSPPDALPDDGV
jgi:two-component sensor histidine kinase